MNSINEAVRKGPLMTMTLECETEFPKALKDLMVALDIQGAAVYKGFPVMDEGVEYWWVQLHLYKNKEDNHKETGFCMYTNTMVHTTFFELAREAAWRTIKELSARVKCRLCIGSSVDDVVASEYTGIHEKEQREVHQTKDSSDSMKIR